MFRSGTSLRWLGRAAIAAWAFLALVAIGSLAVSHTIAMPGARSQPQFVAALLSLRDVPGKPFLVHVIYGRCSCTDRLFAHLVERGRFPGAEEVILYVGDASARRAAAQAAGFRVHSIEPDDLRRRFGLESAPVLAQFDAQGRLRYAGGYFDHPSATRPLDERIHARLAQGAVSEPLPVYGCAVSDDLRRAVDPLGLVRALN